MADQQAGTQTLQKWKIKPVRSQQKILQCLQTEEFSKIAEFFFFWNLYIELLNLNLFRASGESVYQIKNWKNLCENESLFWLTNAAFVRV